ncbi:hypothetical protein L2216_26775, partial [Xanthomonas perforans]|nr:hypothetical protein [Xanthomonas perforans]
DQVIGATRLRITLSHSASTLVIARSVLAASRAVHDASCLASGAMCMLNKFASGTRLVIASAEYPPANFRVSSIATERAYLPARHPSHCVPALRMEDI